MIPARNIVLRDFKRGAVKVVYKERGGEITRFVTLSNSMIPDQHMAETNPNHPLEADLLNAWDTERLQWVRFNLSDVTEYKPFPGYEWGTSTQEDNSGDEERTTLASSKGRTRNRKTKGVQTSEETQTDDRGTEAEGKGEPRQGKGSEGTTEEQ